MPNQSDTIYAVRDVPAVRLILVSHTAATIMFVAVPKVRRQGIRLVLYRTEEQPLSTILRGANTNTGKTVECSATAA